ncbi:DUF4129 domain-containing protein [Formosa sediminum]|uniref:DUF4129 domain-containing protein n=1 Tax=Formosa sediminum TaxID=2594004 RepID=A0A516GTS5_9FLAO|nr:DUF4129 domain-containing protein [Formosa sediminum]QDO94917.1 DUF4129 domain-containing protein [Formosa sediminum]
MIRKTLIYIAFLLFQYGFSAHLNVNFQEETDSVINSKTVAVKNHLEYTTNLKDKYNGSDFKYNDHLKATKKAVTTPDSSNSSGLNMLKLFANFMTSIFPIILGLIVVLIILKTVLGTNIRFWNTKTSNKKVTDHVIYEDEDIHDTNFESHIKNALSQQNYRLATRYYYLALLKKLSDKKTITYHKDKTNSEYIFEIQNKNIKDQFSNISYIYSYVWYGEFPIDAAKFQTIEQQYKSIFNTIN